MSVNDIVAPLLAFVAIMATLGAGMWVISSALGWGVGGDGGTGDD